MKLCYEILDQIKLTRKGLFFYNKNVFQYYDECLYCGEPFLSQPYWPSKFCSKECTNRYKHDFNGGLYKERNPNWRGGASFLKYCESWSDKEFKEYIFERDSFQCQNPHCNNQYKTSNNKYNALTRHHINYNKQDCRPENILTLCKSCNSKANGDRMKHQIFYMEIICQKIQQKLI